MRHTLDMVDVGASIPALVFIIVVAEQTPLMLEREMLALCIVRILVGSLGIIPVMPLTTLLAGAVFGARDAGEEHERAVLPSGLPRSRERRDGLRRGTPR